MNFSDLGLSEDVLRAVADAGYTTPTPIQEKAIPVILMGRDILGCAQTGTGKTAGFTLPMIDILARGRAKARMPRSLILEPTRELAAQVAKNFEAYGKYHKLTKALLIGGESLIDQIRIVDRGVDVLIATPGRLLDLFERGRLLLTDVKVLVIDEADRMLDMGFIPDVERIVSVIPKIRQTLFFAATMPPEIRRLADAFLMNPKEISVSPPATPAETVIQGLVVVEHRDGRRPGGGPPLRSRHSRGVGQAACRASGGVDRVRPGRSRRRARRTRPPAGRTHGRRRHRVGPGAGAVCAAARPPSAAVVVEDGQGNQPSGRAQGLAGPGQGGQESPRPNGRRSLQLSVIGVPIEPRPRSAVRRQSSGSTAGNSGRGQYAGSVVPARTA